MACLGWNNRHYDHLCGNCRHFEKTLQLDSPCYACFYGTTDQACRFEAEFIYYATEKAAQRLDRKGMAVILHSGNNCVKTKHVPADGMVRVPESNLGRMKFRRCEYCFG